jgi:hypothetical protein
LAVFTCSVLLDWHWSLFKKFKIFLCSGGFGELYTRYLDLLSLIFTASLMLGRNAGNSKHIEDCHLFCHHLCSSQTDFFCLFRFLCVMCKERTHIGMSVTVCVHFRNQSVDVSVILTHILSHGGQSKFMIFNSLQLVKRTL